MIEVDHVTRRFGAVTAVQDVSFQVGKGEILGLLGPNAAGKTTTMRIITAFLPSTSGTVRIAGHDVNEDSIAARSCIGYLPENVPLYTQMRAFEYLRFVSKIKGVDSSRRTPHLASIMELCGLDSVKDVIIGTLSKGYRQRVGLAQALLGDPQVLILDEPTTGLDPKQIIDVRQLIKNLGGERTVIVSSHILPEVSMTCSRVVIINEGQVVAEGTPENLMAKLRGCESLSLQVEGPPQQVIQKLRAVSGVSDVFHKGEKTYEVVSEIGQDVRSAVASAVVHGGLNLLEMYPIGMSLEEVYLKLTTSETGDQAQSE